MAILKSVKAHKNGLSHLKKYNYEKYFISHTHHFFFTSPTMCRICCGFDGSLQITVMLLF